MSLLQDDGNDLPPVDENKNYLEELVGDNKKFKTPEDLAKGKYIADQYIETIVRQQDELRKEYQELREKYNARESLEELLTKRTNQQPHASSTEPNANDVNKPAFDPNELKSLIRSEISESYASRQQEENFNLVRNKLKERYGDNFSAAVKKQIDSLGVSEDYLNNTAKQHPQVIIRLLGLDQPVKQETFQAPPHSQRRGDNFAPTGGAKRTWAWYQKERAKNPDWYRNPKTVIQMHNDRLSLGTEFEDGDFHNV